MCSQEDPVSGFRCKELTTRLFHCPPHMLGSSNVNYPPILWRMKKGGFTNLEEDTMFIPILAFSSDLYGDYLTVMTINTKIKQNIFWCK
jgi:hypothetical protein